MPTDPTDSKGRPDPGLPTSPPSPEAPGADHDEEVQGGDLSDPTFELEPDCAITEEVSPEAPPSGAQAPEPVAEAPARSRPVGMGRLFSFSVLLGVAMGIFLAFPLCGDIATWCLPPVLGGVLVVLLAARWGPVEDLNPQHIGLSGATTGVVLGTLLALGMGLRLWLNMDQLRPLLVDATQGQMPVDQALVLGLVCMVPMTQVTFACVGLVSARWTLSKIRPEPR